MEEMGEGKKGKVQGPSQGNNLCGCLGEATEGLGGCGDGFPELWQVPVLGVLGDASHGLTQYLRNRGCQKSLPLSSEGQRSPGSPHLPALCPPGPLTAFTFEFSITLSRQPK